MDNIFTSPTEDGTAILRGHSSHAKVQPLEVQRDYLHFSVVLRPWVMVQPRESNLRPPALQSCALPTKLIPPVQFETQNNVKLQNKYTEILLYSTGECQPLDARKSITTLYYYLIALGPFIWRKVLPKKRVTLQLIQRKKIVDFFARANSARIYFDCLALTELTQLGELKCLYGETLDQPGGWPYLHKRVNRRLGGSPF